MSMLRIGLVVKRNSPEADDIAAKMLEYIKLRGWKAFIPTNGGVSYPTWSCGANRIPGHDMHSECEYLVAIGGDGTMLQAASYTRGDMNRLLPVLGVNVGRVGYLATTPPEDAVWELSRISQNEITLAKRTMLRVKHPSNGYFYPVLNDVVLHWTHRARLINLYVSIEDDGQFEIRADGIIISTPTGSTAYNYAAGGPLIHNAIECKSITPICPFSGLKGTLLLPMSGKLTIMSDGRNEEVGVTIDGHHDFTLGHRDLEIDQFPVPFTLLNPRISSYLDVLKTKLNIVGKQP